jgi:hypothetical protein
MRAVLVRQYGGRGAEGPSQTRQGRTGYQPTTASGRSAGPLTDLTIRRDDLEEVLRLQEPAVLGIETAGVVHAIGGDLSGSVVVTNRERRNGMTDTSGSQTHHHEVARPDPSDTRAYLEQLTKAVFTAGLNWKVVENKWQGSWRRFTTSTRTTSRT